MKSIFLRQSYLKSPKSNECDINREKCKKSFFITEKISKYRKCPALTHTHTHTHTHLPWTWEGSPESSSAPPGPHAPFLQPPPPCDWKKSVFFSRQLQYYLNFIAPSVILSLATYPHSSLIPLFSLYPPWDWKKKCLLFHSIPRAKVNYLN